jgi:hypothetical protein
MPIDETALAAAASAAASATSAAASANLAANRVSTAGYDSGWITVGYPGTAVKWTDPDGAERTVPVFQNSWYHQDSGNKPVQVRRRGDLIEWRGWMKKTVGAEGDAAATTIAADDIAVTGLEYLLPTVRNYTFSVPTGSYGTTRGSLLVGLGGTGPVYSLRYGSGSGDNFALDSVRYSAEN